MLSFFWDRGGNGVKEKNVSGSESRASTEKVEPAKEIIAEIVNDISTFGDTYAEIMMVNGMSSLQSMSSRRLDDIYVYIWAPTKKCDQEIMRQNGK